MKLVLNVHIKNLLTIDYTTKLWEMNPHVSTLPTCVSDLFEIMNI